MKTTMSSKTSLGCTSITIDPLNAETATSDAEWRTLLDRHRLAPALCSRGQHPHGTVGARTTFSNVTFEMNISIYMLPLSFTSRQSRISLVGMLLTQRRPIESSVDCHKTPGGLKGQPSFSACICSATNCEYDLAWHILPFSGQMPLA